MELGYASTVHRAQGVTVDTAHVLAAPGMTRQALYVAMTRGRSGNHVHVATDSVDPASDALPDPGTPPPTARQILEAVLGSNAAQTSATATRAARHEAAGSLAALAPVHQTLLAAAQSRRWADLLPGCGLTPGQAARVTASPAWEPLVATLTTGERLGHAMAPALTTALRARPAVDPGEPVRDLAAVLHHRLTTWLDTTPPPPGDTDGRGDVDRTLAPGASTTGTRCTGSSPTTPAAARARPRTKPSTSSSSRPGTAPTGSPPTPSPPCRRGYGPSDRHRPRPRTPARGGTRSPSSPPTATSNPLPRPGASGPTPAAAAPTTPNAPPPCGPPPAPAASPPDPTTGPPPDDQQPAQRRPDR